MTEITFHFNVPDRLHYSCRLLRKAYQKGASVVVTGEPEELALLDQLLWCMSPIDFVPHCLSNAAGATLGVSPLVLSESLEDVAQDEVLINLGQVLPAGFERFERCIEVVTAQAQDRLAARQRWKHYANRGYVLKQHNFATSGE